MRPGSPPASLRNIVRVWPLKLEPTFILIVIAGLTVRPKLGKPKETEPSRVTLLNALVSTEVEAAKALKSPVEPEVKVVPLGMVIVVLVAVKVTMFWKDTCVVAAILVPLGTTIPLWTNPDISDGVTE